MRSPFEWTRIPNNRRPASGYDWRVVVLVYAAIGACFYSFLRSF